jgi:hypothetical protein
LVGLALGQRVLTLHYDGETLQSWRHSMLPTELRDEDVLEDLQLTLWPVDAIRSALPPRWRIEESGLRRTIFIDDMPVMVIDYSGQPRWIGSRIIQPAYHYRLTSVGFYRLSMFYLNQLGMVCPLGHTRDVTAGACWI